MRIILLNQEYRTTSISVINIKLTKFSALNISFQRHLIHQNRLSLAEVIRKNATTSIGWPPTSILCAPGKSQCTLCQTCMHTKQNTAPYSMQRSWLTQPELVNECRILLTKRLHLTRRPETASRLLTQRSDCIFMHNFWTAQPILINEVSNERVFSSATIV